MVCDKDTAFTYDAKNTQNTSKQPLKCGLLQDLAEASPHPPHTRGTSYRRLQPYFTEKHKVSCSGFPPNTSTMQRSCSHYNAFLQPQIPKHNLTAMRKNTQKRHRSNQYSANYSKTWPKPARTRRTRKVPVIAGCSHFTRKNTRFRSAAFPPTQAPCNIRAPTTPRSATRESTNA